MIVEIKQKLYQFFFFISLDCSNNKCLFKWKQSLTNL